MELYLRDYVDSAFHLDEIHHKIDLSIRFIEVELSLFDTRMYLMEIRYVNVEGMIFDIIILFYDCCILIFMHFHLHGCINLWKQFVCEC